ncbi:MAG: cysteine desulfurase [Halobacteriales archaeon]|nr:cysteine desulfurase [Halobacteriales archaeon]
MEVSEEAVLDTERLRADFPILEREVGEGVPLVYLDNAATTQTPEPVIDAIVDYYRRYNANVHRGIHQLSQEASIAYEDAHDRLAEFIGADGREEMVFTKNTTESINLVAYAWGLAELGPGDAVVTTEMEHHSSLLTWQRIADRTGADIRYIRVDEAGRLDMDHARELIDDAVEMVSVVHVSNMLGTVNPIQQLADLTHDHGALIFADGAQAVPNRPVDVQDLDVDFYAFSGHKMAGPTGIGGLYGRRHLLEEMEPFLYGGEMIKKVTFEGAKWNDLPWKFEAGTPVIAQGIALAAAADYLEAIGLDRIRRHEHALASYTMSRFEDHDDVTIYGPPADEDRGGVVTFNVDGIHPHDLSSILNDDGVAIRAGDHCTQPLHDVLDISSSARASFYLYNTREEVDVLVVAVDNAREIFA